MLTMKDKVISISLNRTAGSTAESTRWSISITDFAGSGSKKAVLYEKTLCNMSYFEFSGRENQRTIYGYAVSRKSGAGIRQL